MAVLEIVKEGHPVLKKSAKSIRKMTDDIRCLAEDMVETLISASGAGLAANQVARPIRMIAVMHAHDDIRIYVNPRITKWSDDEEFSDEGCLSFPLLYGAVARRCGVVVQAQDINMKKCKIDAQGFLARIFQHEIDHLNGITFTERAEEGSLRRYTIEELQKINESDEDESGDVEGEVKAEETPEQASEETEK